MTADLGHPRQRSLVVPGAEALRRRFAPRHNLAASRRFAIGRRQDLRFSIVPYDFLQIVNALVVLATVLTLLVVVLDPHLTAWHASLPPRFVEVFRVVTDLGKSGWILVSTGLFFLLMLCLDASTLRARLRVRRAVRALAAGYVFLAVAVSGIIANLSKYLIGRARPKHFEDTGNFAFDFWTGDASWASFPSGHATTAMSLGVALALIFPRLRWVFLCLGFWIAISRMITRAHYPSDVLAGAVLGGVTAWLVARAFARYRLIFGFDPAGWLVRRKGASGRLV